MGNFISCTSSTQKEKHYSTTVKVIFPAGVIRQFNQPIKAAELMLEAPNFFVVNSGSLRVGRRFVALNADEDLESVNVYAMFPMKRVNSVVTAADMGALFIRANSAAKGVAGGNVRVLPEFTEPPPESEAAVSKLNSDDLEEFPSPELRHRLSMYRSKKPLLETIAEEPAGLV